MKRGYWKLTHLRDKNWMPSIIVKFIDWIRYEFLWEHEDF